MFVTLASVSMPQARSIGAEQDHPVDGALLAEVSSDAKQLMRNGDPSSIGRNALPLHGSPAKSAFETSLAHPSNSAKMPVHIELYYETRCPDCVEFINGSLAALWQSKELREHYEITMYPYGNAQSVPMRDVSEGYRFWHPEQKGFEMVHICQHGNDECFGNLVQACVFSSEGQEKAMELVFCMARVPEYGLEKSSFECMEKLSIDPKKIRTCVGSREGNNIMTELSKKTAAVPGRTGTPWVMINGNNLENPNNLIKSVCGSVAVKGISSCAPFEKKAKTSSSQQKPEGDGDTFQVLSTRAHVDKNLVILPPPRHV
jgi:hypothetical protein